MSTVCFRLKKNQAHQSLRCSREDQADISGKYKMSENIVLRMHKYKMPFSPARQVHGEASIEKVAFVQGYANEDTSDNMNNVYNDLRSSKILDTYNSNVTKEINFRHVAPNMKFRMEIIVISKMGSLLKVC